MTMANLPCKRRQRDLTGSLLSEDIVTVGAGVGEIQRAIRAEGDTHTEGEIYQISSDRGVKWMSKYQLGSKHGKFSPDPTPEEEHEQAHQPSHQARGG